jgi:two-component system, NtrC family, nitrogen regulation response regulator NtrX
MNSHRIIVVDDEPNIGLSLKLILEHEGFEVLICDSAKDFRTRIAISRVDACLIDVRLPDGNGIDLLRDLRQNENPIPVIMISGHGTIADAVEATRAGAFDFLEKPLGREKVLIVIKNALEQASLQRENARFREIVGDAPKMIAVSPAFVDSVEQAAVVARSDARVLLTGESGTGKELIAAHIHAQSPFAGGPFVKVNCAAIPTELLESELFGHEKGAFTGAVSLRRGKFELADGGTIFLDEVGDLHEASQAKLLRVLQEGEFQRVGSERTLRAAVRVISATNRKLQDLVAQKKFREDLFYRLSVVPVRVPSLRERREDIRPLAEHFLDDFCLRNNFRRKTIEAGVFALFENYTWPGNVRELKNIVERMAILTTGNQIPDEGVPLEIRMTPAGLPVASLHETRDSAERASIIKALDQTSWNVSGAARLLGIERTNLHKRIRALGITRDL